MKKIGEVLIEKGLITANQLEMALKAQLIYGGHLGTCLIEQGLIDEDSLGKTLSEVTGAPYAPPSALLDVPDGTIRVFPRRLAEEYLVIPMKVVNRLLHLAMVNPRDLEAIDEISFASGFKIVPWVAPELRVCQALERYYDIPRRLRYISICRALEQNANDDAQARPSRGRSRHVERDIAAVPPASAEHAPSSPGGALRPEADTSMRTSGAEFGYGRSWLEIAEELERAQGASTDPAGSTSSASDRPLAADRHAAPPASSSASSSASSAGKSKAGTSASAPSASNAPSAAHAAAKGPSKRHPAAATQHDASGLSLDEVAERLCQAEDLRQASAAVLDYCASRMEHALLLGVTGRQASLWDSRPKHGDAIASKSVSFSVTSEPIFTLLQGEDFFRGHVSHEDIGKSFHAAFGIPAPGEILMIPVHLNDRLVAIFYGDAALKGKIAADTDECRRLFRLFAHSVGLILVKQKIRALARTGADAKEPIDAATVRPAN